MDLSTREERGTTVVTVEGRIDTVTTPKFEAYCLAAIEAGARRIALDFSGLLYISSAGLSSVLAVAKRAQQVRGSLVIAGLTGMVKEIFSITGFDSIIPVKAGLDEVIARG